MSYKIISDTQISTCTSDTNTIDLVEKEDFDELEFIAKSNSLLYRCHHIRYNKPYAVKIFIYHDLDPSDSYFQEANFTNLSHPNIIHYEKCKDEVVILLEGLYKKASYILMELARTSFSELISRQIFNLDETLARTYFRQIVEGVKYLHSQKIYHLDLKPSNLLLGFDNQLKIADFDLAMKADQDYLPGLGTINFRAPELIKQKVENPAKCDIFSIGIILFKLMFGKNPFNEERSKESDSWLKRPTYAFFEKFSDNVSFEFKKLFTGMTCLDPEKRFSIKDIEESSWYNLRVYSDEELTSCLKEKL